MEKTIQSCIQSALSQDYDNFEVIVADNQSTDKTFDIASKIKNERLRVIRNEANLGMYANHNRCLEIAHGDWIKFLHGDDELLSNCVSKMADAVRLCPKNTALIGCGAIVFDHKDRKKYKTYIPQELFIMMQADVKEFILEGNFFGTPTMVLLHRKTLLDIGGFNISMGYCADGDCWIKLRRHFASAVLPEHLIKLTEDPLGSLEQRSKRLYISFKESLHLIKKWYLMDEQDSKKIFHKTIYADWLSHEMLRYWNSALRYMVIGRLDILSLLLQELYHHNMILKSFWYYLYNRLRGLNASSFRSQPWTSSLKKLQVK